MKDRDQEDNRIGTSVQVSHSVAYEVLEMIGEGAFGKVYTVSHRSINQLNAMKILNTKEDIEKTRAKHEVKIHQIIEDRTKCSHLSQLLTSKQFTDHVCLFFNKFDIDLKTFMRDVLHHHPMELCRIKLIAKQVLCGLACLHSIGFTHADLTPQNLMIVDRTHEQWQIKIIDFGNAIRTEVLKTKFSKRYQTPQYRAPEVLSGNFRDDKIDIWSFGVILVELFTGDCPFKTKDVEEISRKQNQLLDDIDWSVCETLNSVYTELPVLNEQIGNEHTGKVSEVFDNESSQNRNVTFKQFLEQLLQTNPEKRCTAKEASEYLFLH